MTSQSKVVVDDEEARRKAEQKRQVRSLMIHIFANVSVLCIPITCGPKVVADLYKGDFAQAAKFIGACSAGTAAFEFLVNPTVGCWSDGNGRRMCFLVGPLGCTITSALYALAPQSLSMIAFTRIVGNGANAISGSTTTMAALTDVCKGDSALMTECMAEFGTWASMGVVVGPALGGALLGRFGDKTLYGVRALISLLHTLWLHRSMPETLAPEKRKPFDGQPVNPFSFLALFRTTPMLTKLTVYNLLSILSEGKCMNDLNQLWMKSNLSFTVAQTATWTMSSGILGMLGGALLARPLLRKLGPRGATSCAALFGALTYFLRGAAANGGVYWTSSFTQLGCSGAGSMRSVAAKHAGMSGLGAGEYQGMYANLRALIYIIGPLLYTRLYANQVARGGNPGAAYFSCALLSFLLPELMHRTWSDDQLTPWNAQAKKAS